MQVLVEEAAREVDLPPLDARRSFHAGRRPAPPAASGGNPAGRSSGAQCGRELLKMVPVFERQDGGAGGQPVRQRVEADAVFPRPSAGRSTSCVGPVGRTLLVGDFPSRSIVVFRHGGDLSAASERRGRVGRGWKDG